MYCLYCTKETENPKFCNRSCSASYNNSKFPKRIPKQRFCKCGEKLSGRLTVCASCNPSKVDWTEITIGDLQNLRKYQINSRIRNLARYHYNKSGRSKFCCICRYNKHIEICHIRDINKFDLSTSISIVNDQSNLIALCPNCHWEFDNQIL